MRRRLLVVAGLALLAACADHQKTVNETATVEPVGWGCLNRVGELADDLMNPTPPPFCRIGILSGLQQEGRALPVTAVLDRGAGSWPAAEALVIDLTPGVAAPFHAAFADNPSFVPLATAPPARRRVPPARCRRCRAARGGDRVRTTVGNRVGAGCSREHAVLPAEVGPGRRRGYRPADLAGPLRVAIAELRAAASLPGRAEPAPGAERRGATLRAEVSPPRSARRHRSSRHAACPSGATDDAALHHGSAGRRPPTAARVAHFAPEGGGPVSADAVRLHGRTSVPRRPRQADAGEQFFRALWNAANTISTLGDLNSSQSRSESGS